MGHRRTVGKQPGGEICESIFAPRETVKRALSGFKMKRSLVGVARNGNIQPLTNPNYPDSKADFGDYGRQLGDLEPCV